jgi:hypothetical protein
MPQSITFLDLKEANHAERQRLLNRRFLLERKKAEDGKTLEPDLEHELQDVIAKTKLTPTALRKAGSANEKAQLQSAVQPDASYVVKLVDPLLIAVRAAVGLSVPAVAKVADPVDGAFPGYVGADEATLAVTYGILTADNQTAPDGDLFSKTVSNALGEYTKATNKPVFDRVLDILSDAGGASHAVRTNQWAAVARQLRADNVTADNEHIQLLALDVLSTRVASGETAARSSIDIILPDLDSGSDIQIVVANVKAMKLLYFAAMLEEVKFFAVTDKLVELFQNGMLPLGRGPAGDGLFAYWKKAVSRLSETERRNLYMRGFGFPGGDVAMAITPNRDFSDLWLRFISAVSNFNRQSTVDQLLRSNMPSSVNSEQVKKAGRDLGANLSLHGYGIAYFAATELQQQINDVMTLLNDPEIRGAYGARDMWQLIEQVSIYELGGAKNTVRYRTMATAGGIIVAWIGNHTTQLTGTFTDPILDLDTIRRPPIRAAGVRPTENPTDRDLVDACDQWLAVTGTQDQQVSEYSQPVDTPNTTSRPIQIPQAARDLLESVGVQAAYTGGPTNGNGRLAGLR